MIKRILLILIIILSILIVKPSFLPSDNESSIAFADDENGDDDETGPIVRPAVPPIVTPEWD